MELNYDEYQIPALCALKERRELSWSAVSRNLEHEDDDDDQSIGRGMIVMAGGLGKTIVAAKDVKDFFRTHSGRILVLCHDTNVLAQSLKKFEGVLGQERSLGTFYGEFKNFQKVDVLFASFQTLESKLKWKKKFSPDEFQYIIVDEAHHIRATTYERVIRYFRPKFLLGLTATPYREDGKDLSEIFGSVIYELDHATAIAKGYLVPIDYRIMGYEVSKLGDYVHEERRFTLPELNERIATRHSDEDMARDVEKQLATLEHLRVVVFVSSIQTCDTVAQIMSDAVPLHSKLPMNEQMANLERFRIGEAHKIVAVDKLNEGIDVPEIDVIVRLRPTNSRIVYRQQLFRGARLSQHKEKLIVLDYVSNLEQIIGLLEFEQRVNTIRVGLQKARETPVETTMPEESPIALTLPEGEWKATRVDIMRLLERVRLCKEYTDDDLLRLYTEYSEKVGGRALTFRDFEKNGLLPSPATYISRFGNLENVAMRLGLPYPEDAKLPRYDYDVLMHEIVDFTLANKRPPTLKELGGPLFSASLKTYQKVFGSCYSDILEQIREAVPCPDDIVWDVQAEARKRNIERFKMVIVELTEQLERVPLYNEVNKRLRAEGLPMAHNVLRYPENESMSYRIIVANLHDELKPYVRRGMVKRLLQKYGGTNHIPTIQELNEDPEMPSRGMVSQWYDSYCDFLEDAGLLAPRKARIVGRGIQPSKMSDEELEVRNAKLLRLLVELKENLGRVPRRADLMPNGLPSHGVYQNAFGSFSKALILAGVASENPYETKGMGLEERRAYYLPAVCRLREVMESEFGGRLPTKKGYKSIRQNNPILPSWDTLKKTYGSIERAIEMAEQQGAH